MNDWARKVNAEWRRPDEGAQIFKDGNDPNDIQQGALGDCYYLTAISTLKTEHLIDIFCLNDKKLEICGADRFNCGAYICKFMIKGQELYVIIDDRFPYKEEYGGFIFGKCLDKTEIWC